MSQYQKGKTNLDFTEARDSEWQWYQLGHMQVCTSLQTNNHASTPPLSFFTCWMPFLPPNQQCQSTEGTVIFHRKPNEIPPGYLNSTRPASFWFCKSQCPTVFSPSMLLLHGYSNDPKLISLSTNLSNRTSHLRFTETNSLKYVIIINMPSVL